MADQGAGTNARITYRFTFIDVSEGDESEQSALHHRRAGSASPCRQWASIASPEMVVDAVARQQLRMLQQPGPCAMSPPSRGSMGHPNLCKRPCLYVIRPGPDRCPKGPGCGFCHYPHNSEPQPDKRQRELIKTMPKAEFLNLVTELLQERVQRDGLPNVSFLLADPRLNSQNQCPNFCPSLAFLFMYT